MNKLIPILALLPAVALATGIEATPAKLEITAPTNQSGLAEIVVANPTVDVQMFEVYPDDFGDIIEITPASFVLEAGARKIVTVVVKPNREETIRGTSISIVGKPLAESRFTAGTGIKIPLSLKIVDLSQSSRRGYIPYLQGTVAALVLMVICVILKRQRGRV